MTTCTSTISNTSLPVNAGILCYRLMRHDAISWLHMGLSEAQAASQISSCRPRHSTSRHCFLKHHIQPFDFLFIARQTTSIRIVAPIMSTSTNTTRPKPVPAYQACPDSILHPTDPSTPASPPHPENNPKHSPSHPTPVKPGSRLPAP